MNKPVSFEIAKMLKEKGFDEESLNYYRQWYREVQFRIGSMFSNNPKDDNLPNEEFFLAPTITDVVMWLYEKYGIWINIFPMFQYNENRKDYLILQGFQYYITLIVDNKSSESIADKETKNSPTEAYEKAIEHTLNNLI